MIGLIAAIARDGAIGHQGHLPWPPLAQDRLFFRSATTALHPLEVAQHYCRYPNSIDMMSASGMFARTDQNAVVMGRRTWESLPAPLAERIPMILTHTSPFDWTPRDACVTGTLPAALDLAARLDAPHTWVIGGAQVYADALCLPALAEGVRVLCLTEVDAEYPDAETRWPAIWLPEDTDPEQRVTKVQPDGTRRHWSRTHVSAWVTEPDRPRYRFGIWERRS